MARTVLLSNTELGLRLVANGSSMQELLSLPGHPQGVAHAVNDAGDAAGEPQDTPALAAEANLPLPFQTMHQRS